MGCEYTKEFTVDYTHEFYGGYHAVYLKDKCTVLKLMEEHPNFNKLFDKLKSGATYKFIISGNKIMDIQERETYHISGKVCGFIDMSLKISNWKNAYKIILSQKLENIDLIVKFEQMKEMILNRTYDIYYVKAFGYNYYKVTDYVDCGF
jgi:hypothetical protein